MTSYQSPPTSASLLPGRYRLATIAPGVDPELVPAAAVTAPEES